jgi:hypothetical protein
MFQTIRKGPQPQQQQQQQQQQHDGNSQYHKKKISEKMLYDDPRLKGQTPEFDGHISNIL